jgi:hypothetical protein
MYFAAASSVHQTSVPKTQWPTFRRPKLEVECNLHIIRVFSTPSWPKDEVQCIKNRTYKFDLAMFIRISIGY